MIKSGKDEGGYSNRLKGLTIEGKKERNAKRSLWWSVT